ncbi:MAG: hypothetical protein CBC46_03835 [Verrucomicrobiaceae bacterium TMED86]|nr:MAG: hypothetical protein CBC46_03835 [Verrucomicrobiaceae bacterium TMED86]
MAKVRGRKFLTSHLNIRRDQMSASLQKIVERNLTTRATVSLSSIGASHQKNNLKSAKHINSTG